MADKLRKDDPEMAAARVPGTKEVASRENDVIAGDDELVKRKTENVRVPGDTEEAEPGRFSSEEQQMDGGNRTRNREPEPDREAP